MSEKTSQPIEFLPTEEKEVNSQQPFQNLSQVDRAEVAHEDGGQKTLRYFLASSLAINVILLDRLIFTQTTTQEDFFDMVSPIYVFSSIILTFLAAMLFGLSISKWIIPTKASPRTRSRWSLLQLVLGLASLILSIGCPICGSPGLSGIGVQEGVGVFPFGGLELKLAAILLLWLSYGSSSKTELDDSSEVAAEMESQPAVTGPPPRQGIQRLRQPVISLAVIIAVLATPFLPPDWKVDFTIQNSAPNTIASNSATESDMSDLVDQVLPPEGYSLDVAYSNIGPQLVESGAIDYNLFVARYEKGGAPLNDLQLKILSENVKEPITIQLENAHFLLNFFWALGLTNKNPILDEGPMMEYSEGDISRFASTGGWSLGQKDPTELYSSTPIITLSPDQQSLVEKVAAVVYRPCCNNPTIFPDCNHGMAMLGLLELLAANGSTEAEMLEAAKYFNAFWFPQQSIQVATYLNATTGLDFNEVDAEHVVGPQTFSGSGFQGVYAWLGENGLLQEAPSQGGSCGV